MKEETRSKCCKADVYWIYQDYYVPWPTKDKAYCKVCRNLCEVEEAKEK